MFTGIFYTWRTWFGPDYKKIQKMEIAEHDREVFDKLRKRTLAQRIETLDKYYMQKMENKEADERSKIEEQHKQHIKYFKKHKVPPYLKGEDLFYKIREEEEKKDPSLAPFRRSESEIIWQNITSKNFAGEPAERVDVTIAEKWYAESSKNFALQCQGKRSPKEMSPNDIKAAEILGINIPEEIDSGIKPSGENESMQNDDI